MPQINLLPWREELRQRRQKSFIQQTLLIGLVTLLVLVAAGQLIDATIDAQKQRNELIQAQINSVNIEIQEVRALRKKRDQLLNWIEIVQGLQQNRNDIIHTLNSIAHATSDQLYLTRLKQDGSTLTIEGEADGNRQISHLMRKLAQAKTLENPTLTDVSASTKNAGFNHFTLKVEQHIPARLTQQEAK